MRINESNANDVLGKDVHGSDGQKIGEVCQLFLDAATGAPEWVTVETGVFGTKESFVPIAQAQLEGDFLTVPYDKDMVRGAPTVNADTGRICKDEEAELYRHYGLDYVEGDNDQDGDLQSGGGDTAAGDDTSGPTTDEAMTRAQEISQEEHEVALHEARRVVQKETVAVERVAFSEESVTENVQVTEVRQEQIDTDGVDADSADRTPRR